MRHEIQGNPDTQEYLDPGEVALRTCPRPPTSSETGDLLVRRVEVRLSVALEELISCRALIMAAKLEHVDCRHVHRCETRIDQFLASVRGPRS